MAEDAFQQGVAAGAQSTQASANAHIEAINENFKHQNAIQQTMMQQAVSTARKAPFYVKCARPRRALILSVKPG